MGDFNGDGIPDIAAVDNNYKLRILLGDGRGGFNAAPGAPGASSVLAVGDFTGNEKLDVAYAYNLGSSNLDSGYVGDYLGNGDGTFTPGPAAVSTSGALPVGMAAGDFTGNDRDDLVVLNGEDGAVDILLSNPNGGFTTAPGSPLYFKGAEPFAAAVGDFTGHGRLDIAIAFQNAVEVLINKGNGVFSKGPVSYFPGQSATDVESIVAGDFNGDGRLDLAAADQGNNDVFVMLNKGDGRFVAARGYPVNFGSFGGTLATGDFTGNGREDVAVGADGEVTVLLNKGNGTFTSAEGSPVDGGLVATGNFDGNHEPDLVVGNANNDISVLLNTTPPGLPTGTLGARFCANVPGPIRAGARFGTATVTLSAPAGKVIKGAVSVSLYGSPDLSLFDATQVTAKITENVTLKAGTSKALRVPISLFASAPVGTYHLIAAVDAPDGTTTAVAGPSVTITKAFVSILESNVSASPAAVAPDGKLGVSLTLQNTGNVQAAGTAGLTISLSAGPSDAGSSAFATVPLRVKLKAGRSGAYRVKFRLPAGTAAGSYYLVASLAVSALGDTNAADGIAVSGMPITVS